MWVSLNKGNGTFQAPTKVLANFGYNAGGWRVEKHPRFLADLTGDGGLTSSGSATRGLGLAQWPGNAVFPNPTKVIDNFGYDAGRLARREAPRFVPGPR